MFKRSLELQRETRGVWGYVGRIVLRSRSKYGDDFRYVYHQCDLFLMFVTKDSGERTKMAGMQRDTNTGKVRYDLLIPLSCSNPLIKRWAELMARGAEKYTARNWEGAHTQEEYMRFKESAFRHFMQWYFDDVDEDHAAAVFFNIQGAELTKERLPKTKGETINEEMKNG